MSSFEAHSDAPKHRDPVAIKVATKSAFESGHKKSQKKWKEKGAKKSGSYVCWICLELSGSNEESQAQEI